MAIAAIDHILPAVLPGYKAPGKVPVTWIKQKNPAKNSIPAFMVKRFSSNILKIKLFDINILTFNYVLTKK